ncbi:VCBS repeat-containing protein [Romeria aff. gracilis LEGE 07310]|uniref:VCBS repeat-containing protein n=1 Tax=Vasconcelosia minhoensis LEGE 07310 TaxID=915328 RepID=A0A8J7AKI0_9CYAN|nr:VCBS repeat-containing protein [Romeria aff. gracilis LEGE 07310]
MLKAGFGDTSAEQYVDILSSLQDGSFTLDAAALEGILGQPLSDGSYTLNVIAEDSAGNASQPVSFQFTLDTTGPAALSLVSPVAGGTHSGHVHLVGSAEEAVTVDASLNGAAAETFTLAAGEFDQLLQALPLSVGGHQLALTLSDAAGNITQTTVAFEVAATPFVTGPQAATGWAVLNADTLLLGESDSYVVQASLPVALGSTEGSRTLRFAVDAGFDVSDTTAGTEDLFALYLVDAANPAQTLLDGGTPGTPLFSLRGETAEFTPGLVRYDGRFVEVDLSGLTQQSEGRLVFQLLNQDGDTGSRVQVSELTNTLDPEGISGPRFPVDTRLATIAGEVDFSKLSVNSQVKALFSQVRFNPATGEYTAELRLHNTGTTAIGRQAAVVFEGLPTGVTLQTQSGTDANGNGYVSLRNAIPAGGLAADASTAAISATLSNPDQLRLALTPQVWVSGPNQAPVLPELGPLTATPGQKLEISLVATDADGDRVTYSLRSDGPLPKGKISGSGKLTFEPTPEQIGEYGFTLVATDGAAEVTQSVSLTVAADPLTTTKISGRILDIDGNSLANLPLALGRLQAVTDANGNFTLTIPATSFPTEEINIQIPLGDPAFDPFRTGTSEINLRRTTFDGATGTSTSNPLRHPNLVSTFMDASMVYGTDAARASALRTNDGTGRLKVSGADLLPVNNVQTFPNGPLANNNRGLTAPASLFATGDVRANENLGLTALHTVFVREHNRLADEISLANPGLSGEELYQRTRQLVAAQIQQITYAEFLPQFVGAGAIGTYSGYDAAVDPSVSHLFSAAAFRLGHTQSADSFLMIGDDGQALPTVALKDSTFNPAIIQQYGIDPVLRGLFAQSAQAVDTKVIDALRDALFGPPGAGGIDLAAVDIQRGRDVGLPDYNQARVDFGLAPVSSFAEITSDVSLQQVLQQVYGSVDDIDVIVGGLAEDKLAGSMVGELFQQVIVDQFERLRDGDRFWYENSQLSADELAFVRGTSLKSLIERNTGIDDLPGNLFSTGAALSGPGAGGAAAAQTTSEYRSIDGSDNNLANPELGKTGTRLRVDYTQAYGDGIRSLAGANRPNVREISNAIFDQEGSIPDPTGATAFMLAWSQFVTHDMTFAPDGAADTLKVYGNQYVSSQGEQYPFVAEKLKLMLGHEVYAGVNNVIERPIYLPALDVANNVQTTDSSGNITITNAAIGSQVQVAANSMTDNRGNPFTGSLSISKVPTDLTPAALPEGLSPDLVVTIQPGEMLFTQPAQLTMPNEAGWPAGMEMDLWSINPITGEFEIVGKGAVSADRLSINTIEGGIRNSSWHFFSPPALVPELRVEDRGCVDCATKKGLTSQVELHTGGVTETHDLLSYQSLGEQRGLRLTYDSLRADARHIVQFGGQITANGGAIPSSARLVTTMTVHDGNTGIDYQVPGYTGDKKGLDGGEHIWDLPESGGEVNAALQADLRDYASGVYDFSLELGAYLDTANGFTGSSSSQTGELVHVNTLNSAFGSGWGIAGVQELVETAGGSVLLIDGDGSELVYKREGVSYKPSAGDMSVFEKLADGTFRRTTKEKTVYSFNADNRLVSIKAASGNETRHIYVNGQLTKIVDPVGLETTFTYTGDRVSAITDPAGRTTQLKYDAAGNLTQVIDPDSSKRTWSYDAEHHMTAEVDQRGSREETVYDFAGRATHGIRKDGSMIRVQPIQTQALLRPEQTISVLKPPAVSTKPIDRATYVDANGNVSTYILDDSGHLLSGVDGGGSTGVSERNFDKMVTRRVNGRGKETRYTYDERGNLLTVADEFSRGTGEGAGGNPIKTDFYSGRIVTSINPVSISTGDFNNDGHLDYATANASWQNGNQSIFFGDGQGGFSSALPIHGWDDSSSVLAADLDQDGNSDLIVVETGTGYGSESSVHVLWGSGEGSFERVTISSDVWSGYRSVVMGDIDGNGYGDLLVKDYTYVDGEGSKKQVKALFNDGSRTFVETLVISNDEGNGFPEIELGDVDGDGDLDAIAYYTYYDDNYNRSSLIQTFRYEGSYAFSAPSVALDDRSYDSPKTLVWTVDVNQDGYDDVIFPNGSQNLSIALSAGDGTFGSSYSHDLGLYAAQVLFADVNTDGRQDIIGVSEDDAVSVSLANLQGGFGIASLYDIGDYDLSFTSSDFDLYGLHIPSLKIADVDRDGDADIVTANYSGNSITVLYNDGAGAFGTRADYVASVLPAAVIVDDFNQDGLPDMISAGDTNVFLKNTGGQFTAEGNQPYQADFQIPVESSASANAMALEDVDGDGYADFVSLNWDGSLVVAYGGGGSFTLPITRSIEDSAKAVKIGDIDGDGTGDIVFTRYGSAAVSQKVWILKGGSNLEQGATESIDVGFNPGYLELGDFNGDGKLDILLAERYGPYSKLLLNDGLGSFTQTGVTQIQGTTLPLSGLIAVGDLNGDGRDEFIQKSSVYENGQSLTYLDAISMKADGGFESIGQFDLNRRAGSDEFDEFSGSISSAKIVDLNQDGRNDLLLAHDAEISVFMTQPDGSFGAKVDYPGVYEAPRRLNVGDVNADGKLDVVLGGRSRILVMLGEGDGTFKPQDRLEYVFQAEDGDLVFLNDLDQDGDADLIDVTASELFVRLSRAANNQQPSDPTTVGPRTYTYDLIFNQMTSQTDELGRQTRYEIDPTSGMRLSMTQVVGQIDSAANGETDDVVTAYTYTSLGLLDVETDPLGRQTDYDYDALGRMTRVTYAKGTADETIWHYEYNAVGNQTAIVDPNGHRTEYAFDAMNRMTQVTYAKGTADEATERYEYDVAGNQVASIDANGNRSQSVYDVMNRAVKSIAADPDGAGPLAAPVSSQTYDKAGNLTSTVDPLGRTTRYVYDSRNRLVKIIRPDGAVQTTRYDFDNNPVSRIDAKAQSTRSVYDARGRLVERIDENGDPTRFEYDAANQLIAQIDANGVRTEFKYDQLGRQIAVTTAAGSAEAITTRTEYDAVGNAISQTDGLGQRSQMSYDSLGRLILSRDAGSPVGETLYAYDAVGNLLSLTDAVGNTTSYVYDARDRVISETNELGNSRSQSYDANGNLIRTTDRNGSSRSFAYDGLNRQTSESWLDGLGNAFRSSTMVYDAASQLVAVQDPDSAYQFGYDALGRQIRISNAGTPGVATVVLDYAYDADGNLISVRDSINGAAAGVTSYAYDSEDRMTQVTQSGAGVDDKRVDFAYDAIGQFEAISRYSDLAGTLPVVASAYDYDELNRLKRLSHSNTSGELAFYDFAYDAANRITQISDVDGNTDYSYNARNELTGADHTDGSNPDESYDYDANGNRIESHRHGSGYVTGTNNQLLSDGIYTYAYDPEGNLVRQTEIATGKVRNLTWDYLNRLVIVVDVDSTGAEVMRVEYTYDVIGRRIAKSVDSDGAGSAVAQTLRFGYDRDHVLLEFAGASESPSMRYLYGPQVDQIIAQEDGSGTTLWLLSDHLGTVKDRVDDTGNLVNHRTFDSYGNLIAQSNTSFSSRYGFTGREFDEETGLHYYRARYYDGQTGRFISQDPIGFEGNDANPYRYVFNVPVSNVDPLGLFVPPVTPPPLPPAPPIIPNQTIPSPYTTPVPVPQTIPNIPPRPSQHGPEDPNSCDEPCEGWPQGGAYFQVREGNRNRGAVANHTPAWNSIQLSGIALAGIQSRTVVNNPNIPNFINKRNPINDGYRISPAICMDRDDDARLSSRGSSANAREYRRQQAFWIANYQFETAQAMDIVDIRTTIGYKYEEAIIQMQSYTTRLKAQSPYLFRSWSAYT